MFGSKKDKDEKEMKATGPGKDGEVAGLKPGASLAGAARDREPSTQFRPEIPRRPAEIPGAPGMGPGGTDSDDTKKLIVGREICLSGEITACEKLVVEGRVEANLSDSRIIDIAATGYFKGNAEVDEAIISGEFQGDLRVRGRLFVRATGRVSGDVRYGELEVERGGRLSGDIDQNGGTGRVAAADSLAAEAD